MRLLYLDEAGTDRRASALTVAGVLIHGDKEWPEVDRRIAALIDKYIPEPDRLGFIFHATDIFHGSGYFDRRKPEWPIERRMALLGDLAAIIGDLRLPVVSGGYEKEKFGRGVFTPDDSPKMIANAMHNSAAMDCLTWTDKWLAISAPSELALVTHEDGTNAKPMIKYMVGLLRSEERMKAEDFPEEDRKAIGLPLKHIIDTVHFAEKADARPLQLADLCAFMCARMLRKQTVYGPAWEIIWDRLDAVASAVGQWRQRPS